MPLRQTCLMLTILCLGLIASGPVLASNTAPPPAFAEEATTEAAAAPETGSAAEPAVCTDRMDEIETPAVDRQEKTSCCLDECFQDRDCDSACAPFGGECMEVNSCCRECFCFG